jgi:hypothetical protein
MPEPLTEQELEYVENMAAEGADAWFDLDEEAVAAIRAVASEVRRLRELHADALRQIKLVQEKADREIARLKAKNEELQRRDDYVTGCMA